MGYHSNLKYLIDNQPNAAKYEAWKKENKAQRQASYKTATDQGGARIKVVRTKGYLIPMGAGANQKVAGVYPVFGSGTAGSPAVELKAALQPDYQKLTLPAGLAESNMRGRKQPAIVRWTQRDSTPKERTSRILGGKYSARLSDSASGGVGKKEETQDVAGTATSFQKQIEGINATWQGAGAYRLAKLIPEINFVL
jgi:hypothetical protein